jgi:hypothetical protein
MEATHNIHHILAKASTSVPWTNHPDNRVFIPIKKHRALHELFDLDAPHQQINRILQISETVWEEDQLNAIDQLFKSFKGEYYKRNCVRDRGINYHK